MTDTDRQDRDGLRARLEDERNELENSFGHGSWADGLTRDRIRLIDKRLATLPTMTPTRDAAEGAGKTLSAMALVESLRLYPTLNENDPHYAKRECFIQGYVIGAQSAATPQPAPDAMREAIRRLAEIHVGAWLQKDGTRLQIVPTAARQDIRDFADAVLKLVSSAPVPPADGAGETRLITDADREYASELLADLTNDDLPRLEIAARWFRKARVERSISSATGAAEPVAWRWKYRTGNDVWQYCSPNMTPPKEAIAERLYATPPVRGDREAIADYRRHWWSFFHGWFRDAAKADDALETAERAKLFDPNAHAILSLPVQPGEREKALSDYTNAEIATEHYNRAQAFLGDPRIGVTVPTRQPPQSNSEGEQRVPQENADG